MPRGVDRMVARVLGLDALRRGEEATLPRPVSVGSLGSEVLLARGGMVLLRGREIVQGWRDLAAKAPRVVDGGGSAGLTAATVEGTGARV